VKTNFEPLEKFIRGKLRPLEDYFGVVPLVVPYAIQEL